MFFRAPFAGACLVLFGAVGVVPSAADAQTTTQVSPYFLIVQDTSGSMTLSTEAPISASFQSSCAAHGDMTTCTADSANYCLWLTDGVTSGCYSQRCGSLHPLGSTATNAAACTADTLNGCTWAQTSATGGLCTTLNSCGHPHTRMSDAKCALQQLLSAYGDAQFGLETYNTACTGGSCSVTPCDQGNCGFTGCTLQTCDATGASAAMRVPVGRLGAHDSYDLVDYSCAGSTTSAPTELFTAGSTPLGGSLQLARTYFSTGASIGGTSYPSPLAGDTFLACRPVSVILLTDGVENCGGNAAAAATALRTTPVGASTVDIRTYVIGLGVNDSSLNTIASNGGTGTAFSASDDASLSAAFAQIIAASIRVEQCDGVDNNCNMLVDEGFPLFCNAPSHPARDLCSAPAETLCDGVDNNCNGQTDEGLLNLCGTCGAAPLEQCDRLDNDCDGGVDEGGVCNGCTPSVEICDNMDNDCNGVVDMITRPCGMMVGACTAGLQTCINGVWGTCSGINPTTEVCDNVDNDCDGTIDGQVSPCGSMVGACRQGLQVCTNGMNGACIGGVGPTTERCDLVDNDCDGLTDEMDPGGGGACGAAIGVCMAGTYHCMAGMLTCTGGTTGSAEICDTLDNDCDGSIDEGIASMGACTGGSSVGVCRPGMRVCSMGAFTCVGLVGPTAELCDNLDNDCDGMVDEMNPEGGAMCGDDTGACMAGTTQCMGGVLMCQGAVGPTTEVCNAIDDDCNGVIDDGIPVGAPCGSSMGECLPGVFTCDPSTGMLVCTGAINGTAEICDTLDNDCDGAIDESVGGGGACGSDVGDCMQGTNQCVGGAIMCVGEIPPAVEICDCHDNDCNGMTDDPPPGGSLCPSGSACVMCQCASECSTNEFGDHCPAGTIPLREGAMCHCVAPACDATTCAGETHMDSTGAVACAPTPGADNVGPCVCRNNACTFACEGVVCTGALVCNPRTGACVDDSCNGLGCPDGQICNMTSGGCEPDPCATTTCAADEACRGGHCEDTCASAMCTASQTCHAGVCSTDMCVGMAACPSGFVCNPSTGHCDANRCIGVTCPGTQVCDPLTGTCHGDPCIGLHCPAMTVCRSGECVRDTTMTDAGMPMRDAGTPGMDGGTHVDPDGGTTPPDDHHRALASGGPLCSVGAVGSGRTGAGVGVLFGLLALAGVLRRRPSARRRHAGRGGER